MNQVKRIVAIGPESTGKSTICIQLALYYHTEWVPEYARNFLELHDKYEYEDLLTIAKGQLNLEDAAALKIEQSVLSRERAAFTNEQKAIDLNPKGGRKNLLFIDTDMYVMKVWCEFVYNRCHNWILSQIATRQYAGYLLCNIDLPWEQDGMREYPDKKIREKLYHYYKDLLINQSVPWIEISGNQEERTAKAIQFVDSL